MGGKIINEKKKEAINTLKQENLKRESAFVVEIDDKLYFVGIDETEEGKEKQQMDMSEQINKKHKEVLEQAFKNSEFHKGQLIYDLRVK